MSRGIIRSRESTGGGGGGTGGALLTELASGAARAPLGRHTGAAEGQAGCDGTALADEQTGADRVQTGADRVQFTRKPP